MAYSGGMKWKVSYHADFADELASHGGKVLDTLEERIMLLEEYGHMLGRPHADTLNGSKHPNMKELMFDANAGFGGWLSPSTPRGGPSFLWLETNRARASAGSTDPSSHPRTGASTSISSS